MHKRARRRRCGAACFPTRARAGAGDLSERLRCYCGEAVLRLTWPHHENGPVRPVRHHTLTEYRCEVTASTVSFGPVNKSSSDSFLFPALTPPFINPFPLPSTHSPSIRYPILNEEIGNNAKVILLKLQLSMGGGISSGSRGHMPLENAIEVITLMTSVAENCAKASMIN
ncbi:hypothetical protein EVAR_44808_1 [Eumeta japonica]|uniref:Uncharacterized protein n=1 Tax=Eumeta variegata TaxID=151549 RepID=A0A4C1X9M5_EUMVA|nr:hypothetical protein EVAR_44808_1 [Eumeta japonica]